MKPQYAGKKSVRQRDIPDKSPTGATRRLSGGVNLQETKNHLKLSVPAAPMPEEVFNLHGTMYKDEEEPETGSKEDATPENGQSVMVYKRKSSQGSMAEERKEDEHVSDMIEHAHGDGEEGRSWRHLFDDEELE